MNAEDWLYNDGYDAQKSEYVSKLDELKKIGNKLIMRLTEEKGRKAVCDALRSQIEACREFVKSSDEKYAHISDEDKDKVREAVKTAEEWLFSSLSKQGEVATSADPTFTCAEVESKRVALFRAANPIMSKPKPAPPKPEPTPADAKATEQKMDEEKGDKSAEEKDGGGDENENTAAGEGEAKKDESVPMEEEAKGDDAKGEGDSQPME